MKNRNISFIFFFIFQVVSLSANARDCYEAVVMKPSPFLGNNGEVIQLDDGTLWEIKYEYEYLYEYFPEVVVCPSKGILIVDGKKLNVEQLK